MTFLNSTRGSTAVEWLVVAVIIVAVVGSVILSISDALADKLTEYHDAL
jgi:Flp pilus assembly pilin Flp